MEVKKEVRLNNGISMPVLGLGTWKLDSEAEAMNAVKWALGAGYRLIDTAAAYGNEENVGKAIRASGIPRKEIFLTTKIWNSDHRDPMGAFETSLKRLGTDYVDLYLIHWPVTERLGSWKVLEEILKSGRARSIGVSNFTVRHLKQLLESSETVPAVNQVEFHPFLYQKELLEFCRKKGIQPEGYSPLTRGRKIGDERLEKIAAKHSKSVAQVMIRWQLQHGMVVIPKSARKERILENRDVFGFSLSEDDMKILDGMNEDFRVTWDPEEMP